MESHSSADYRFLIPKTHSSPVGTQGEMATSIPYCLEPGITPDSIRREMARQPHMRQLAKFLAPQRQIYLLQSTSQEQLELAAQYIGTFHRLHQGHRAFDWAIYPDDADSDSPGAALDDLQSSGDSEY